METSDPVSTLHSNIEYQQALKEFAVADADHDFKTERGPGKKSEEKESIFLKIYNNDHDIGTPLPDYIGGGIYNDPWNNMDWTVNYKIKLKDVVPGDEGSFTTNKTGFTYDYKVFNDTDIESSLRFIYGAGQNESLEGKTANIAIDVIKGYWWKTIQSSYTNTPLGTINILNTREQLNDAGTRPVYNSECYKQNTMGSKKRDIIIKSLIDVTETPIVYLDWNSPRNDFHSDFFSRFSIQIDPVKYKSTSATSKIIFSLENNVIDGPVELSSSERSENSVNSLIEKLRNYNNMPNKTTDMKNKYYKILQQKRSGDTLQAFSTLDKGRTYNEYLGNKINSLVSSIPSYLMTIDVYNPVPIGLLNGVNIIYQGYKPKEKISYIIVFRRQGSITGIQKHPLLMKSDAELDTLFKSFDTRIKYHTILFNEQRKQFFEELNVLVNKPLPSTEMEYNLMINNVLKASLISALFEQLYTPTPIPNEIRNLRDPKTQFDNVEKCSQLFESMNRKFILNRNDLEQKIESLKKNELLKLLSSIEFSKILYIQKGPQELKNYGSKLDTLFKTIKTLETLSFDYLDKLDDWFLLKIKQSDFIKKYSISEKKNLIHIGKLIEYFTYNRRRKMSKNEEPGRPNTPNTVTSTASSPKSVSDAMSIVSSIDLDRYATTPSISPMQTPIQTPIQTNVSEEPPPLIGYKRRTPNNNNSMNSNIVQPIAKKGLFSGGKRFTRKQKGGEIDSLQFSLYNGGSQILHEYISEYVAPLALSLAKGNTLTDSEVGFIIKYFLIHISKFYISAPNTLDDLDNLSYWAPIFVEIFKVIVNEKDSLKKQEKLRFILRIWTSTSELFNIFEIPEEIADNGSDAGQVLLFQMFGPKFLEEIQSLPQVELYDASFPIEFTNYSDMFINNFNESIMMAINFEIPLIAEITDQENEIGNIEIKSNLQNKEDIYEENGLSTPVFLGKRQERTFNIESNDENSNNSTFENDLNISMKTQQKLSMPVKRNSTRKKMRPFGTLPRPQQLWSSPVYRKTRKH